MNSQTKNYIIASITALIISFVAHLGGQDFNVFEVTVVALLFAIFWSI